MATQTHSITRENPVLPEKWLQTKKQGRKGRTGSRSKSSKTGSRNSNQKDKRGRGNAKGANQDFGGTDAALIRDLLLKQSPARDDNAEGPRRDSTGMGRVPLSKETRLSRLEIKHPPKQPTVSRNQRESKVVPGSSAFESSREKAIGLLRSRIDRNRRLLQKPENQLPDFKPGQGIVGTAFTTKKYPFGTSLSLEGRPTLTIGSNKYYQISGSVEYKVLKVDQNNKKVKLYSERYGTSWRSFSEVGKWLDFTPSKIGNKYKEEQTIYELRSSDDLSSSAKRVPRRSDKIRAQVVKDVQLLHQLQLEKKLGPKRTRTFNMLMARYQTLSREYAQQVTKLIAWRDKNGAFSRLFYDAPQRARMETLDKAMKETRKALEQVRHNQPLTVSPGVDPELSKIALADKSDIGQLPVVEALKINKQYLKEAAAAGRVGDAWVAYHSTVQPYLFMKTKQGESFHRTADGKASLTFAINQAIQKKVMGERKLVLTSADLEKLRPEIEENWKRIHAIKDGLNKESHLPGDWSPPFDKAVIDAEIARLKRIEQSEGHKQLSDIVSPETINPMVDQIVSEEPSWVSRFGNGLTNMLEDPEFWGMVAVGALTMGTGTAIMGAATLGRGAVTVARLVHLYRQGALTSRAFGLFAAGTAIDGAAFHTGMNLFNIARGKPERADWGPDAYGRSIVLMSALYGVNARHILRQMKMSPAFHRKMLEGVRHFGEETAAMTSVGLGEALLRNGNLKGAAQQLEHNAQFLLAMRIVHGGRKLLPKIEKAEGKFLEARDAFIREPNADNLSRAFEALRAFEKGLKESLAPKTPELAQLNPMQRGQAVTDYMRQVMDAVEAGRVNGDKGSEQALRQLHGWARSAFTADNKGGNWNPGHKRAFVELNGRLESLMAKKRQPDSAGASPSGRTAKQDLPILWWYSPGGGGRRQAAAMRAGNRDDVANKDGEPRSPWAAANGGKGSGGGKKPAIGKKAPVQKNPKAADKKPAPRKPGNVDPKLDFGGFDVPDLEIYPPSEKAVVVEDYLKGVLEASSTGQLGEKQLNQIAEWVNSQRDKDGGLWSKHRLGAIDGLLNQIENIRKGRVSADEDFPFRIPKPHIGKRELLPPSHDAHVHGKGNYPFYMRNVDANHIRQLMINNDRQMAPLEPFSVYDHEKVANLAGTRGKSKTGILRREDFSHRVPGTLINTFPVAPPLHPADSRAIGFHVNRTGLSVSAYYAGAMPHSSIPWSGHISRAEDKDGKTVWKVGKAVMEGRHNTIEALPAFELTNAQLTKILGVRTIPDHINEFVIGVTAPCCHAMGPYNPTRDLLTTRDILGLPPEFHNRVLQGLASSDPFEEGGWKNYFHLLRAIDFMERQAGFNKATVLVSGWGEITLAKEMVLKSISGKETPEELFNKKSPQLDHVISFLKAPLLTGSSVLVHMDAGNAPTFNVPNPLKVYGEIRDPSGIKGDRVTHDRYIIQVETDYSNGPAFEHILQKLEPYAGGRGGKVIWAHLGGLGRYQRLGPDHFDRLRTLLKKHDHLYIDASWDVALGQLANKPKLVDGLARLIHEFPDRFLYGSDSVGQGDSITGDAHFNNLKLAQRMGLLDKLRALDQQHGTSATEQFLRNNFEDVLLNSALLNRKWRGHPDVREWMNNRGFDPKEGKPYQHMPVIWVKGNEHNKEGFYYNMAYYLDLHGSNREKASAHINRSQELQKMRGEIPFPVTSDYSGM